MDEPGSFSGKCNSPIPHRGPEANKRMLLEMCIRLVANNFNAPEASTILSWLERASNLFSAVTNGNPVSEAMCPATFTS